MFEKTLFIGTAIYFIYQLVLCYKEKNTNKRMTGLALGLLMFTLALTKWPVYLNDHLCFGIVTCLYAIGMFYEWLRQRKQKEERGFYFFTAILLGLLSGLQFIEYFN